MEFVIVNHIEFDAPPEPHDVKSIRLYSAIDGVAQPAQEKPIGQVFDIEGKVGQEVEAYGREVGGNGLEGPAGDPVKFKIVDDVLPGKASLPKVAGTSKKFPATGPTP